VIRVPLIFFLSKVPRSQKVLAQNAQQPLAVDLEFDATGEWQWAIDPKTLQVHLPDPSSLPSIPSPIFDSGQSPLSISVTACPIQWMTAGSTFATSPPTNPSCTGANTTLSLMPLGVSFKKICFSGMGLTRMHGQTTKLRISEFPVM